MTNEEELLQEYDHIEKTDNGKYKVTCPFDETVFEGDTLFEARKKEGVYRSKKHIDSNQKIQTEKVERQIKSSVVDDWRESAGKGGKL